MFLSCRDKSKGTLYITCKQRECRGIGPGGGPAPTFANCHANSQPHVEPLARALLLRPDHLNRSKKKGHGGGAAAAAAAAAGDGEPVALYRAVLNKRKVSTTVCVVGEVGVAASACLAPGQPLVPPTPTPPPLLQVNHKEVTKFQMVCIGPGGGGGRRVPLGLQQTSLPPPSSSLYPCRRMPACCAQTWTR